MHTALLDRSIEGLQAVRRHASFSARLRDQLAAPSFGCKMQGEKCFDLSAILGDAPDATAWRVIDHCIAISRAYALFEAFIFRILREYISFLAGSYKLSDLGDDFVGRYSRGVGQILVDQSRARYEKIDISALVAEAAAALSNKIPYQIQPEALLRTDQNLRMTELQRLFNQCGLNGIDGWVTSHRAVRAFFSAQSRLSETAESELKQIVGYRNEAVHGEVDQVLGTEVLLEVVEFFEVLIKSIADFVQYDIIDRAKRLGKAQVIGIISERFQEDIVVAKVAHAKIQVGDPIYIVRNRLTLIGEVKSIQLNDVPFDIVEVTDEREVGLRLGVRAPMRGELVRLL